MSQDRKSPPVMKAKAKAKQQPVPKAGRQAGAAPVKKEPDSSKAKRADPLAPNRGTKRELDQESAADATWTCAICGVALGEDVEGRVKRATKDATGSEVTDGCLNCVSTLSEGWPGWSWAAGRDQQLWLHSDTVRGSEPVVSVVTCRDCSALLRLSLYESRLCNLTGVQPFAFCSLERMHSCRYVQQEGGGFQRTFEMARLIRLGEKEAVFTRCNVLDVEQRGTMVFVDFALLTDKEFQELLAERPRNAKTLKSEPTSMYGQTGKTQQMHVLSLRGMSCCEIHSCRRLRVYSTMFLAQEELLVEAAKMLHSQHAANVFQANWEKIVAKQPTGLRDTVGFRSIPSTEELLAKADEMAVERAMRGAAELPQASGRDSQTIDLEAEPPNMSMSRRTQDVPKKSQQSRRRQKVPQSPPRSDGGSKAQSVGGASKPQSVGGASKPQSGAPKSRKGSGASDAQLWADGGDVGRETGSGLLLDVDPQLRPVAEALRQVPPCFLRFSIDRILKGDKMGNQLNGVGH